MTTEQAIADALLNVQKSEDGVSYIEYDGRKIAIIGDHVGIDLNRQTVADLGEALVKLGSASGFAAAAVASYRKAVKKLERYGPCQGCGKPAKLGYCFKCQQKDGVA